MKRVWIHQVVLALATGRRVFASDSNGWMKVPRRELWFKPSSAPSGCTSPRSLSKCLKVCFADRMLWARPCVLPCGFLEKTKLQLLTSISPWWLFEFPHPRLRPLRLFCHLLFLITFKIWVRKAAMTNVVTNVGTNFEVWKKNLNFWYLVDDAFPFVIWRHWSKSLNLLLVARITRGHADLRPSTLVEMMCRMRWIALGRVGKYGPGSQSPYPLYIQKYYQIETPWLHVAPPSEKRDVRLTNWSGTCGRFLSEKLWGRW